MTKVYPNAAASPLPHPHPHPPVAAASVNYAACKSDQNDPAGSPNPTATVVLTVWKKSLLFNCNGFTVFDGQGNLVYRVDNYMSGSKGSDEIFLMDAFGNSLLTIRRRKKLSLGDSWLVFDGETTDNPRFLVRKNMNLLKAKGGVLAQVSSCRQMNKKYEIEGSYAQRCCAVFDDKRRRVAEIKQKEASIRGVAFGTDIFHLVVHEGFEAPAAMAMVILLDQMFGSSSASPRRLLTNY